MKPRTLGTLSGEGFITAVLEDESGRVFFVADGDIDADGANGQFGATAAYVIGDKGSEYLANGGLRKDGKLEKLWAKDIFILDRAGQPKVFEGGILASKTWYKHADKEAGDPAAYLDSETENYIVVPPLVIQGVRGVVRGCKARVTWKGRTINNVVVGDKGPRNKIGEISIALARALGMPSSPRTGGVSKPDIFYELWPGIAAPNYELQPA